MSMVDHEYHPNSPSAPCSPPRGHVPCPRRPLREPVATAAAAGASSTTAVPVKGKEFPPETTVCNDNSTRCFGRTLTCPAECPQFKPADPTAKGCFVDCNDRKCEGGICRHRKPNCDGNGASCYDPRFVGGDGVMFYFHGKAGGHFALVSDPNLQINAGFIGLRPAGRRRDFTWIQSLGLRFGRHSSPSPRPRRLLGPPRRPPLSLLRRPPRPPQRRPPLLLVAGAGPSPGLFVERNGAVNTVIVTLAGVFEIKASVVPVTKEDSAVHRYGVPDNDCFAHLAVQFKFFGLSESVEGVLGQTYRPGFDNPVKRGVPMPVMGGEDRYATSGLLASDCRSCIFSPAPAAAVAGSSRCLSQCSTAPVNPVADTPWFAGGEGLACTHVHVHENCMHAWLILVNKVVGLRS
uniref:Uncharacterized protein n=1 Tax=Ananas comosus var. bracteatus TaxID=296719 RepID=A0A6V7QCB3_ANACO|nr:unnamed protein product [Ananas comosus var. bracteatus]